MLSQGLKQWWSTWWEGRANPGELRCMQCTEWWKGWSQDPLLPRPHLRVGSGGKGILLEIPAYLRLSEGKQLLSFVSVLMVIAFENILTYCTLGPCYCVITAVLSIVLQWFFWLFTHWTNVKVLNFQMLTLLSLWLNLTHPQCGWGCFIRMFLSLDTSKSFRTERGLNQPL